MLFTQPSTRYNVCLCCVVCKSETTIENCQKHSRRIKGKSAVWSNFISLYFLFISPWGTRRQLKGHRDRVEERAGHRRNEGIWWGIERYTDGEREGERCGKCNEVYWITPVLNLAQSSVSPAKRERGKERKRSRGQQKKGVKEYEWLVQSRVSLVQKENRKERWKEVKGGKVWDRWISDNITHCGGHIGDPRVLGCLVVNGWLHFQMYNLRVATKWNRDVQFMWFLRNYHVTTSTTVDLVSWPPTLFVVNISGFILANLSIDCIVYTLCASYIIYFYVNVE